VSDLPVRAVLDSTAVAAYGRGAVSVGEILAEITDEHAGFAVPELCLIEAAAQLDVDEWPAVALLVSHSQCVRLETPTDWRDVARAARHRPHCHVDGHPRRYRADLVDDRHIMVVLRPVDPTTLLSAPRDPLSSINLRRDPDALMDSGPGTTSHEPLRPLPAPELAQGSQAHQ
jgi:hypothetical protein